MKESIEVGRIVLITQDPSLGKLAVIVEVIDTRKGRQQFRCKIDFRV